MRPQPNDVSAAEIQMLAQRYANDPNFKADADKAMGVFHIPPHPEGQCRGCDNAREKGLIERG